MNLKSTKHLHFLFPLSSLWDLSSTMHIGKIKHSTSVNGTYLISIGHANMKIYNFDSLYLMLMELLHYVNFTAFHLDGTSSMAGPIYSLQINYNSG